MADVIHVPMLFEDCLFAKQESVAKTRAVNGNAHIISNPPKWSGPLGYGIAMMAIHEQIPSDNDTSAVRAAIRSLVHIRVCRFSLWAFAGNRSGSVGRRRIRSLAANVSVAPRLLALPHFSSIHLIMCGYGSSPIPLPACYRQSSQPLQHRHSYISAIGEILDRQTD
jgi:hypothetical protein